MAKKILSETSKPQPLRLLMVENSEDDVLLTIHALKKGGYDPVYERVENAGAMRKALLEKPWDVILCDYQLPQFNGLAAIDLLKEIGIDIPLIIVSGAIGEDTAVECMRSGACDYIMKDNLHRLTSAIERELKEADSRLKRKKAEEALRKSEEKYRNIIENIEDGYYEIDITGNLIFFNDSVCRILGNTRAELMGMNNRQYTDKENSRILYQAFNEVFRTGKSSKGVDYEIIRKDGTTLYMESSVSLIRNVSGQPIGFRGIMRNITERKKAEEALRESEQRFMDVLYSSPDAILLIDGEQFVDCNEATARMLGYADRNEFLKTHPSELSPPAQPDGRNSFEKANEMMRAAFEKGFHQFEWEHRRANGECFPVEVSLTSIVYHGKIVLHCMWRELTERKRTEAVLQRTLESLRKAVGTTIQVMVSAVESRDPYTAGHQVRSADIARAIATEMGLSQEKIEGIRMAGSIHDIGKLSIPAEILSKPARLSEIEYSLVKEHARTGFEILKNVESPWPLAQIVYQHHERMDGSGYPRNLKGDDILMEARIMAVADVVESMASHRPYRPSLGTDKALDEISKNRGILYDSQVVDACLTLFQKKGFTV